jgi:starch synthase
MKILFVTSEVAPLAKAGGLADVCAALPRHLAALGHDVRIVLPCYAHLRDGKRSFAVVVPEASVALGTRALSFAVLAHTLPTGLPAYLVHCPALYDRPSIYTTDPDEHLRFSLLQWAALLLCQHLHWGPDVVHCNDWQTALIPLMLRTVLAWDRLFDPTRTVLTIHNVAHQGAFSAAVLPDTGLEAAVHGFHQEQLRAGFLNYLLTGILHADLVTTVSPTYAREIQTEAQGARMDPFLRARSAALFGILNGIDEDEWSPERDPHIPHRYSRDDLAGKERDKAELTAAVGLPHDPEVPLIGVVSRLAWQKGFDLGFALLPRLLEEENAQLVVLGRGDACYEEYFSDLARAMPRRVAFRRGFSEPLAHLIEAGADLFLMPSRYEPCGLNQMYSLRYGTVPVVHKTGGLADTVRLWGGPGSGGNGFCFDHFDEGALSWAVSYALSTWRDRATWRELMHNGMSEDFSWKRRVADYVELYRRVVGGG